ncbi:MAG: adenylyltransferase/cytidyltransferase family protein [Nanoarchaeota archaeon]
MKTAVFIGRFQPLHNGHVQALREISKNVTKIIIIIGTPKNKRNIDFNNPLTTAERKSILKSVLKYLKLNAKIKVQRDVGINSIWKKEIEEKIPKNAVIFSGNKNVISLFGEKRTVRIKKKVIVSGTLIRKWMALRKSKWKQFVPKKTVPLLTKFRMEERLSGQNKAGS